ncbi:hypothetical protein J5X84_01620 [Streptosporangiaceae bacterium NEAU-GS5]|nr:hypothetical protein [Streptosporangiaceae bacterium NEAU-GS5]
MNRRIHTTLTTAAAVTTGLAAALAATLAPLAAAGPAQARACPPAFQPYGLIGGKWAQVGGVATLGCPVMAEYDVYRSSQWAGRRQSFNRGQVAWSPGQGSTMTVAAWKGGHYVYFSWGPTSPFSYDKFLVRAYLANDPNMWAQATFNGGTGGQIRWGISGPALENKMRFIVEGCDNGTFSSTCRQGWTIPVDAW